MIRCLQPEEKYKQVALASVAFNLPVPDMEEIRANGRLTGRVLGAFSEEGVLEAALSLNAFSANFQGNDLPVLGIGAVMTYPQFRRKGLVRALMSRALSDGLREGYAVSMLYPFSCDYYRKFGYERAIEYKNLSVPIQALAHIPFGSAFVLAENKALMQRACDCYDSLRRRYNLCFQSNALHRFDADPHKNRTFTYLAEDGSACICLSMEGSILKVQEMYYRDRAALVSVLGFLRSFEGQMLRINFIHLPADSELCELLTEDTGYEAGYEAGAMARVLDVCAVLKANTYSGSGAFSFSVDDPILQENSGVYRVSYAGGKAEAVREAGGPVDCEFEAGALSRVLLRTCEWTPERAEYMEGVRVRNIDSPLFEAFSRRPCFQAEHF